MSSASSSPVDGSLDSLTQQTPMLLDQDRRDRMLIGILLLCTIGVYLRAYTFDFVSYDDPLYITSNVHMIQGFSLRTLRWALTAVPNGNWHPLTTMAQVVIAGCFGVSSRAYHTVNVLLHGLNVVVLYLFLRNATRRQWPAFFAALLWGLHPQRVESVAWISELKDVLCGVFWLACLLAYVQYAKHRTAKGLILVTLLQALSLLGKPMAVTLPAVLLLLDYWPLGPSDRIQSGVKWWGQRLLEKLPMLLLSALDVQMQQHPFSFSSPGLSLLNRIENGFISYALYIRDTFAPVHLGVLYPHPIMFRQPGQPLSISPVGVTIALIVMLGVTMLALLRLRKQPYLAVGWFWFVGTLIPVIGLIQVGQQARADRFTYLPSIGLFIALIWSISDFVIRRRVPQRLIACAGVLVVLIFGAVSFINIGYWRNSNVLFAHLLEIQPNNYLALAMICDSHRQMGDIDQALDYGKRAVTASFGSPQAHASYAEALRAKGKLKEAGEEYQIATALDKDTAAYWDSLGIVRDAQANKLAQTHDPAEHDFRLRAAANFKNATIANPDEPEYCEHLAYQLGILGRTSEAISYWNRAIDLDPAYAQPQGDLADALLKTDVSQAIAHYRIAIANGAKNPSWETKLAYLVGSDGDRSMQEVQPMIAIAKDACQQTQNQDADALDAYAVCLAREGVFDLAMDTARQAIDRAKAANNSTLAKAIAKRLALYEQSKPYIAGNDSGAATRP